MSFSSSGHRKADGLMSIFSLHSSVKFSDGTNSGGCLGKDGSDMRGSDGIRRRIQYSSGRVVRTGRIRFSAFLYLAEVRASNKGPFGLGDFGSGGFVGLVGSGDLFCSGGMGLTGGRPDRR